MANNDGTVELKSELDYRAQSDAKQIFGFDEDHGSILTSKIFIQYYQEVLNAGWTKYDLSERKSNGKAK